MATAENLALINTLVRQVLADRMDAGGLTADGTALRNRQAITNDTRLGTALTALENLEGRILTDTQIERINSRWADYGDQLFSMLTQEQLDALMADPDLNVRRFVKLLYRLAGMAAARAQ